MEVTIEIVGCGERRTGTGKNGKPYDFVAIHFTYESKFVQGKAAGSVNVPGDKFEQFGLRVGSVVNCLMFFKNYQPDSVYLLG